MTANLARDVQMHELRTKWLKEFEKILPPRIAARVIQLEFPRSSVRVLSF